jgi:uncharacterized protein YbjQ (UPF0145 family)
MSELIDAVDALSHPPEARHRGEHRPRRGATSDLTIDETLLLHSAGWEPTDMVFGVSWWSIPWGVWNWQTGVVNEATEAFAGALTDATEQLQAECTRAGGSGVVGVTTTLRIRSTHVDLALVGTAVRPVEGPPDDQVFISDLTARDFVLLRRAGWAPVGIAAGASFVIAPRRSARQWAAQQNQNVELPNLTEALYTAREGAMAQLQHSGRALGADGVVGVKLREGPMGSSSRILQFVAVGTAVRLVEAAHRPVTPRMVVPLDDAVRQFQATSLRTPG